MVQCPVAVGGIYMLKFAFMDFMLIFADICVTAFWRKHGYDFAAVDPCAWEQGPKENIWAKEGEVTGERRNLRNEELHNLYSSLSIIRQIKSRRMRWAGHVACMEEERKCTGFWWESQKENDHLEDQGVD
jgi:hypothetical protein